MVLYLLAPILIFGIVESQTANVTNGWIDEMNKVERNNTLFNVSTLDNSTMTPGNVTSGFYIDEKSQIEDQLKNNQTSFITEDNESFQDPEYIPQPQHCLLNQLPMLCEEYCVEPFRSKMHELSTEDWCVMEKVIEQYNLMTECMEEVSEILKCYYPNQVIQDLFLQVHSSYFHNCTKEEVLLQDAPRWLVITLTLIPVSLIPILTYLVVWKSKVQE